MDFFSNIWNHKTEKENPDYTREVPFICPRQSIHRLKQFKKTEVKEDDLAL